MKDFKIGDKVKINDKYIYMEGYIVGIDTLSGLFGYRYLVNLKEIDDIGAKMYNIALWSYKGVKTRFTEKDRYILTPYEGYAIWTNDVEKIEGVEANIINRFKPSRFKPSRFKLGEIVIYKGLQTSVLAIDRLAKEDSLKYAIKCKYDDYTLKDVKNYSRDSISGRYLIDMEASDDIGVLWVRGEVLKKIEEETSHFIKVDAEKGFEDFILDEYKKLREQKKETIKEMEAEIEKIKRDWSID